MEPVQKPRKKRRWIPLECKFPIVQESSIRALLYPQQESSSAAADSPAHGRVTVTPTAPTIKQKARNELQEELKALEAKEETLESEYIEKYHVWRVQDREISLRIDADYTEYFKKSYVVSKILNRDLSPDESFITPFDWAPAWDASLHQLLGKTNLSNIMVHFPTCNHSYFLPAGSRLENEHHFYMDQRPKFAKWFQYRLSDIDEDIYSLWNLVSTRHHEPENELALRHVALDVGADDSHALAFEDIVHYDIKGNRFGSLIKSVWYAEEQELGPVNPVKPHRCAVCAITLSSHASSELNKELRMLYPGLPVRSDKPTIYGLDPDDYGWWNWDLKTPKVKRECDYPQLPAVAWSKDHIQRLINISVYARTGLDKHPMGKGRWLKKNKHKYGDRTPEPSNRELQECRQKIEAIKKRLME